MINGLEKLNRMRESGVCTYMPRSAFAYTKPRLVEFKFRL